MSYPVYTETEARSRETFLALMWALSYPGNIQYLPESTNGFRLIAESLLDLETSYYTPDSDLTQILAFTGAQTLPAEQAAYHFYPTMGHTAIADLQKANIGTMLYPDTGATLIIKCRLGSGTKLIVQGAGVRNQAAVLVDDIPEAFWDFRASACHFPLGWDIYLVDEERVVGIPRSVQVILV